MFKHYIRDFLNGPLQTFLRLYIPLALWLSGRIIGRQWLWTSLILQSTWASNQEACQTELLFFAKFPVLITLRERLLRISQSLCLILLVLDSPPLSAVHFRLSLLSTSVSPLCQSCRPDFVLSTPSQIYQYVSPRPPPIFLTDIE